MFVPSRSYRLTSPGRRGYTLVELLIALGIFGFAMTGALALFLHGTNIFHYDTGKLRVNSDIRKFTSEMSDNATYANNFRIYPSFYDRSTIANDGVSGDFLVLVYRDPNAPEKTQRIIGYFRAPDDPNDPLSTGPVRKFDIEFTPSTSSALEDLLPAPSTMNSHEEVIELSRGLSNGKLFYNFYDRSIMIKGEILHEGTVNRRATNTYNFTVSPRG